MSKLKKKSPNLLDTAAWVKQHGQLAECVKTVELLLISPFAGYALGNLKPNGYEHIGSSRVQLPDETFTDQVKWMTAIFIARKDRLKKIISNNISTQNAFYKGKFKDALKLLDQHEREAGFSLKSLSNRICFLQSDNETAKLKEIADRHSDRRKPTMTSFFADSFLMRCNPRTSAKAYFNEIDGMLPPNERKYFAIHDFIKIITTPYREFDIRDYAQTAAYAFRYPLEDQYFFYLDIIRRYQNATGALPPAILEHLKALNSHLNSSYIQNILLLSNEKTSKTEQQPTYITHYTNNNLQAAIDQAYETISNNPLEFPAYVIAAKCNFYIGGESRAPSGVISPSNALLRSIYGIVYFESADLSEIDNLRKFAITQPSLLMGHGIESLIHRFSPYAVEDWPRRPLLNPFTTKDNPFIHSSHSLITDTPNISALQHLGFNSQPPESRQYLSYVALVQFYKKDYKNCLITLEALNRHLINIQSPLIDHLRYFQLTILGSIQSGRLGDAIKKCIEATKRKIPIKCLPVDRVLQHANRPRGLYGEEFGELALLRSMLGAPAQDVNQAVEGYLAFREVKLPSELCKITQDELTTKVLLNCCSADVIEWNIEIDNSTQVATERIAICSFLLGSKIVPITEEQRNGLEKDARVFTEYLFRKQAVAQLATTKIYIPREAIETICNKELSNEVNGLLYLKHLNLRIYDLKNLIEAASGEVDTSSGQRPSSWSEIRFGRTFRAILNLFCWNKHFGLDGHLSMTIRHGTLFGQMRAPFQEAALVTDERTEGSGYLSNVELGRFLNLDTQTQVMLDDASGQLSNKIDELHDQLRSQKIQLKTQGSNPEGLFDFNFSETEIGEIWETKISRCDDASAVISGCLDTILERLDQSLSSIRHYIETDVLDALTRLLSNFEENVSEGLSDTTQLSMLSGRVTSCRTTLYVYMAQAAAWFSSQRVDELPAFRLSMLFKFALLQEEHLLGRKLNNVKLTYDTEMEIQGKFFNAFYHIAQILIHNAVEHSGVLLPHLQMNLKFMVDGNKVTIISENCLSPSIDASKRSAVINSKITEAGSEKGLNLVAKEGGSGFAKILRLLQSNFMYLEEMTARSYTPGWISLELKFNLPE